MKKLNLIIWLVTLSTIANSQTDTLVTVNNYKVPVIITEITAREVIYRLPNKPDMPLLHYARFNLKEIILKDGEVINPKYKSVNPFDKKEVIKGKTILYFTPSKLFINQIGFAAERVFSNNHLGICIPFSFAYSDPYKVNSQGSTLNTSFDNKRFWSTGVDINIYPFKLRRFNYVVGVSAQYAQFAYLRNTSSWGSSKTTFSQERGIHYSVLINNGFISRIGKHFIINASTGFGLQSENFDTNIRLNASLNIGYIF